MAAFVVNLFYRPQQGQTTPIPDTAGVFPFDLGVALLENPTPQVSNYNNKIFRQFLPLVGR